MVTRRVDDLGRIAIPKDIRRLVGLKYGDEMHIAVSGENIVITKHPVNKLDDLLLAIATVENEELKDKLYATVAEWDSNSKGMV